jgi:4-amino-4-deoxy-L-arabinose transferase-like glycosyltransferase
MDDTRAEAAQTPSPMASGSGLPAQDDAALGGRPFLRAELPIAEGRSAISGLIFIRRWRNRLKGLSLLRAALVAGALAVAVSAFVMMLVSGETALLRALWFASMALLVLSQATLPRIRPDWVGHLRAHWADYLPLLAIFLSGAWLRFRLLGVIPDDIHGDIASHGLQARAILQGQETRLFTVGWSEIPMFDFWQIAASMYLFGDNLFGMSMSAAIHGMLTLAGVYLLGRELFDRRVGLIAASLLAISYNHIQFSRIVTTASPLTFMVFTFYFLARGLRGKGGLSFVLSGLSLGLGLQVYYPTRMMGVILALLLPWLFLWQRDVVRRSLGGWGLMAAGAFCAFGPFLAFGLQNPALLMGRGNLVTIFNPAVVTHLQSKYGVASLAGVLWENLKRTVLVFSAYGDASTHFGLSRPFVDLFTAVFLALGVGYSLRHVQQARHFLLLVWLAGTLILGSFISNDPPFWPHLIIVLIPVCILAAVALERLWYAAGLLLGSAGGRLGGVLITTALIFVGLNNWEVYYAHVRNNAQPLVRMGRLIASLDSSVQVFLIKEPYARERLLDFFAYGHTLREVTEAEAMDAGQSPAADALYIVSPNHEPVLEVLRQRYPNAQVKQYRSADNGLMFTTLRVGTGGTMAQESSPFAVSPLPTSMSQAQPGTATWNPRRTFRGNTTSAPWDIDLGMVEVSGGTLTLRIGPIPGHDAAYDYVRLVGPDGGELRFEAEDPRYTTGDDAYAPREGADGHWWLQTYGPFSEHQGLVAQKDEGVPILTTTLAVPDGTYHLYIGSFYGDQANGVFGLGVDY